MKRGNRLYNGRGLDKQSALHSRTGSRNIGYHHRIIDLRCLICPNEFLTGLLTASYPEKNRDCTTTRCDYDRIRTMRIDRPGVESRPPLFPTATRFDVVIERDSEGHYVASVPQIPACHTQTRSLDEVMQRIREAIELCLEVEGAPQQSLEFIGLQRITIAA